MNSFSIIYNIDIKSDYTLHFHFTNFNHNNGRVLPIDARLGAILEVETYLLTGSKK